MNSVYHIHMGLRFSFDEGNQNRITLPYHGIKEIQSVILGQENTQLSRPFKCYSSKYMLLGLVSSHKIMQYCYTHIARGQKKNIAHNRQIGFIRY